VNCAHDTAHALLPVFAVATFGLLVLAIIRMEQLADEFRAVFATKDAQEGN
jgi:hypothetical protein